MVACSVDRQRLLLSDVLIFHDDGGDNLEPEPSIDDGGPSSDQPQLRPSEQENEQPEQKLPPVDRCVLILERVILDEDTVDPLSKHF